MSEGFSRGCSQSSQPDESTGQMNEGQERLGQFVIARGDTPEVFDASEEAFDQIAVPIEMTIEAALGDSIGAGRNDGLRPRRFDHGNEVVGIVPLVGNYGLCRQVFDRLGSTADVGNLTRREDDPQWITQGIDHDMQLAGQSAARATDFLTARFFWRRRNAGGRAQWLSR